MSEALVQQERALSQIKGEWKALHRLGRVTKKKPFNKLEVEELVDYVNQAKRLGPLEHQVARRQVVERFAKELEKINKLPVHKDNSSRAVQLERWAKAFQQIGIQDKDLHRMLRSALQALPKERMEGLSEAAQVHWLQGKKPPLKTLSQPAQKALKQIERSKDQRAINITVKNRAEAEEILSQYPDHVSAQDWTTSEVKELLGS